MTIKGSEEALRALREQFQRSAPNTAIREALKAAVDDAMTWGEAEVDLAEVGAGDVQRLAEAAREMVGHDISVTP